MMKHDFLRVVDAAQFFISQRILPGDMVIDATCGNGNDTLFLSDAVGENGLVFAIDIQKQAIENTKKLLESKGKYNNVEFINANHEHLNEIIPEVYVGKISAIMYNLGYLPKSDHNILTNAKTTIESIKSAVKCLYYGGIITICVYPHKIGKEEGINLEKYLKELSGAFNSFKFDRLNRNNPPYLYIITRD